MAVKIKKIVTSKIGCCGACKKIDTESMITEGELVMLLFTEKVAKHLKQAGVMGVVKSLTPYPDDLETLDVIELEGGDEFRVQESGIAVIAKVCPGCSSVIHSTVVPRKKIFTPT